MRKVDRTDPFDGHVVEIFLDEEGDWIARFEDHTEISAFADTPAGTLESLAEAWRLVRESCTSRGEPVPRAGGPGVPRLQVRLGRRVYRALVREAARRGLSLQTLAARKLALGLGKEAPQTTRTHRSG